MVEYRTVGAPLEAYANTRTDRARQAERERQRPLIEALVAKAPPLTPEVATRIAALFRESTPPTELMRWRVRLYCGHIIETTAHVAHPQPGNTRRCPVDDGPDCGRDVLVVAYEPLGRVEEPAAVETPRPMVRRRTRAELEARIRDLERQLASRVLE